MLILDTIRSGLCVEFPNEISRETLDTEVLELEVLLAQNQNNQQTFDKKRYFSV